MTILILGIVLFLATHSLQITQNLRASLIATLGAKPYRVAYSLASLLGFALIV